MKPTEKMWEGDQILPSSVEPDHLSVGGPTGSDMALESDSSVDSLTEQLDQIGRLNINLNTISSYIPTYFSRKNFDIPNIPNIELPTIELPNLELPNLEFAQLPNLPDISGEISRFIGNYVKSSKMGETGDGTKSVNSIRTIVSTRIQMNALLNDLDLGLPLGNAIERLKSFKDVIHEMIDLPVDEDDFAVEPEKDFEFTEPKGIEKIITEQEKQPFISDLVIPEENLNESQRHHNKHHYGRNNAKRRKKSHRVLSDDSRVSSELDIEGLTPQETRELTSLDSLDDFYKENLLRDKIQNIQKIKKISQASKNKLVTRLMMGNYYKYINERLDSDEKVHVDEQLEIPNYNSQNESEENRNTDNESLQDLDMTDEDEVIITEEDKLPSYHNKLKNILGCNHYQRNCKVECPTCLKWFTCRFCHDEQVKDHKLVRSDIKHILCMFCTTPQEPTEKYCIECNKELSNYICFKCKLFDNDYKKDIYHCDKCGICRLGLGLGKDYFHCDECNICLSIDLKHNHKCLNNTTHCNCPICNEYLFTSVTKVVFMKCGHLIHEQCYKELTQHSYKCPLCKKTVVNMETQFRILDQEILQQPLPLPYKMWRCIVSCNDCKGKSNVPYHILGLKCKYCNSYNTNQHKLIKPEEEDVEDNINDHDTVDRMTLVQTTLSNNLIIDNDYDGDNNKGYESESLDNVTDHTDGFRSFKGFKFAKYMRQDNESAKDNEENEDNNNDNDNQDLINIKQFTNKLISKPENNEISYITSIFQRYINNALKEKEEH